MLEEQELSALAAIPVPHPPVPAEDVWTPEQWKTFLAICEVFVPEFTQQEAATTVKDIEKHLPEGADPSLASDFVHDSIKGNAKFKEIVRETLVHVAKKQTDGLAFILNALETRFGSLIMTGSTEGFSSQSLATRARVVYSWKTARLAPLRGIFNAVESIAKTSYIKIGGLLSQVIEFPEVPKHIERNPGYNFQFLDFTKESAQHTVRLKADVVIIGSGCGAGVVAETLAESLKDVQPRPRILVLEKGYHFKPENFPMTYNSAATHMFEAGGGVQSVDGSIAVLAGATWGGGGTVNWSASLQPPHIVRDAWSRDSKITYFRSTEFQNCLDEICERMGACKSTDEAAKNRIPHSKGNKIMMEGARRMGLAASVVPQNTAGKSHACGQCSYGCASAAKQGPSNYWLPLAAENGVEFVQGCWVEKIIFDENVGWGKDKVAIGLKATWTSQSREIVRDLEITCPRIIVSSGTLNSPLVLHRSGLTPSFNRHIGSNLHLHPTLITYATYPEKIYPWEGPILSSVVTALDDQDQKGHGPKLEIVAGTPDISFILAPFRTDLSTDKDPHAPALDWRLRISRHAHSFGIVSLQRDHADPTTAAKSHVSTNPNAPHLLHMVYTASAADRAHVFLGALTAARIHYIMGANIIEIFSAALPVFTRPSTSSSPTQLKSSQMTADLRAKDDEAFEFWYAQVEKLGPEAMKTTKLGSAHQMGTCRMAARREDGAVDPRGRVWGTKNVWVADASVLPSASGVNPMVSTMAVSLGIARGIVEDFKKDASKAGN